MERTTRRSLRKEIDQAQNDSVKESKLKQNPSARTINKQSHPLKGATKVQTETTKDTEMDIVGPMKKGNEKWTVAAPKSEVSTITKDVSPRSPRKRQALPDSNNSSPERTVSSTTISKRFKLSPSTQPTTVKQNHNHIKHDKPYAILCITSLM